MGLPDTFIQRHTPHTPTNNPHLLFAKPPFQNNILLYVVVMDEFDTKDVKSIIYIEPKTNNVTIKITGLPNQMASMMYMDWVMANLGFEYHPDQEPITGMLH